MSGETEKSGLARAINNQSVVVDPWAPVGGTGPGAAPEEGLVNADGV